MKLQDKGEELGMSRENTSSVETETSVEVTLTGAVLQEMDEKVRSRMSLGAIWSFTRHLGEMVVAMLAGMAVLIAAIVVFGEPPGYTYLFVEYALMAVAMVIPMVAWMSYRGHSLWDGWEMSAAMVLPMFALVAPIAFGIEIPGLSEGSLMELAHVAMIGGMVALMIFRWDRYTGCIHDRLKK